MEIVLIRHTAVDVPKGVCYGQTDVTLKSSFEEEADIVRQKLASHTPFDAIYTSPLSRCVRLATHCGYEDATHDRRLMEINFGKWEMLAYDDIRDPRLQEWYDDYLNIAATDGESFMMQYERVSSFLDEVKSKPYRKIAIFTHGGVLLCAQIYAKSLCIEDAFNALTPYGGIIKIEI